MARGEGWHRFSLRFSKAQWQKIERIRRSIAKQAKEPMQISDTLRWMIDHAPRKLTDLNGTRSATARKTYAAWLRHEHWDKLNSHRLRLMKRSKRHVSINETFGYLIDRALEN